MPAPAIATPNILTDPGILLWAPLGTATPTHTVSASKFTDNWPTGWLGLGATEEGSSFSYESNIEAIRVAELFDPVRYTVTERSGNIGFNLADYTLTNFRRAMNGGTLTSTVQTVGVPSSTLTEYAPPDPGQEIRAMIGWESTDSTVRLIAYQCLNGGTIESAFAKAPAIAVIPTQFNFEQPAGVGAKPFRLWGAGVARG